MASLPLTGTLFTWPAFPSLAYLLANSSCPLTSTVGAEAISFCLHLSWVCIWAVLLSHYYSRGLDLLYCTAGGPFLGCCFPLSPLSDTGHGSQGLAPSRQMLCPGLTTTLMGG